MLYTKFMEILLQKLKNPKNRPKKTLGPESQETQEFLGPKLQESFRQNSRIFWIETSKILDKKLMKL